MCSCSAFLNLIMEFVYVPCHGKQDAFCKYICPAGTIEGGLGLLANKVNAGYFAMLGPLFTWKFILMISIVVASIFIFRMFCRFICPLGALYGLFNKISLFGVKVERSKCTDCNKCVSHCKLDIKTVGDQECISCGECIDVCPTKAISWKDSKIFLRSNEGIDSSNALGEATAEQELLIEKKKRQRKSLKLALRITVWTLMAAVLIGAIVYYWKDSGDITPVTPGDPPVTDSTGDLPPLGNQEGNLCYGYDLSIVDGNGVSQKTINPVKTGKVTVINFWGTWCTPCVNELPYFDKVASEYADMVHETAPNYVKEHYPDSKIIFAKDYLTGDAEGYYTTLGGRGTYPYTVVIDEQGVISSVFLTSLDYEELKAAVDKALEK